MVVIRWPEEQIGIFLGLGRLIMAGFCSVCEDWVIDEGDWWVSGYYVWLRIASQPRAKGNVGFCVGVCLCGGIGMDECFGGGFSGGGFGGGTDFVR